MKKLYTMFSVALVVLLIAGLCFDSMAGMKDIELNPDKLVKTGSSISVFPSLANTETTVHFWFEFDGVVTANIIDMQGRVLESESGYFVHEHLIEGKFDVSNYAPGTYFMRLVHSTGKVLTAKFMVAH